MCTTLPNIPLFSWQRVSRWLWLSLPVSLRCPQCSLCPCGTGLWVLLQHLLSCLRAWPAADCALSAGVGFYGGFFFFSQLQKLFLSPTPWQPRLPRCCGSAAIVVLCPGPGTLPVLPPSPSGRNEPRQGPAVRHGGSLPRCARRLEA